MALAQHIVALAVAVAALGCNPIEFDRLGDTASTRAVEAPDGYQTDRFTLTLTAFEATASDGTRISRLAAGGGEATPGEVFAGWTGTDLDLDGALYDVCGGNEMCAMTADPRNPAYGNALVGVPVWRAAGPGTGERCTMMTSDDNGGFVVKCEGLMTEIVTNTRTGILLGASGASLGVGNGVGVAILGAPADASGTGALYRVPDGRGPELITLTVGTLPPGGRLGTRVAAVPIDASTALVVASATGVGRVIVATVRSDGTGDVTACIDDPTPGFGDAVAIGDIDDDGAHDVIVGGVAADGNSTTVRVYLGADAPAPGCSGWGAPPSEIVCPPDLRGIGCSGSSFGAAITTGDVDADGDDDIIVGAPLADVDGAVDAGALYVFPGSPTGPDAGAVVALTDSRADTSDYLGTTVAALPSGLGVGLVPRVEPVGGAPGSNQALVFACTGLPNDSLEDLGERCIPRP